MGYVLFSDSKVKYRAELKQSLTQTGGGCVELLFAGKVKVCTSGFKYLTDNDFELGDYSEYKTVYRKDYGANGYMLSNDETTYTEPAIKFPPKIEPPIIIEPTEEQVKINELNIILETKINELNATIASQIAELNSSDYKILKCTECSLAGLELPYDIDALHIERQECRDKINECELELESLYK